MTTHHDIQSWELMLMLASMVLLGAGLVFAILYPLLRDARSEYTNAQNQSDLKGRLLDDERHKTALERRLQTALSVIDLREQLGLYWDALEVDEWRGLHEHLRARITPLRHGGYDLTIYNAAKRNSVGTDILFVAGDHFDNYDDAYDTGAFLVSVLRWMRYNAIRFEELVATGA